jgi:hypothetical protein
MSMTVEPDGNMLARIDPLVDVIPGTIGPDAGLRT